jgi:hypothetical protein
MKPDSLSVSDLLLILENALEAALHVIRQARRPLPRRQAGPAPRSRSRSKSNTTLAREILSAAGHPLHVHDIVQALSDHGVSTSRDSLVSALSKQIAPKGPFVRTAPNTFGLLEWSHGQPAQDLPRSDDVME